MADPEVCNLLRAWGLEEYITTFQQNIITTLAMAALQPDDIKELFPIIGHRTLFNKNLEDWRTLMHPLDSRRESTPTNDFHAGNVSLPFSDIFIPDSNTSAQTALVHQNDIQILGDIQIDITSEKNLQNLLEETNEGKALLHTDKSVPLTNSQRFSLIRIISNHVLKQNPDQTVKATVYAEWTQEIIRLYPREKASVYFHNKYVMSTRGAVNRLAGKLPDQINNLKRKYRNSGIIPKRVRSNSSCSSQSSVGSGPSSPSASGRFAEGLDDDDEDLKDHITWLKNSSDPWKTVEEKWDATRKVRLRLLRQLTIDEYLQEFPALQKPTGYKLLEADFNFLYGDKIASLKDVFPLVKEKLFGVASAQSKDKGVQNLLTLRNASEDASNLAALLLIPSLISVSTVGLPKQASRKSWRPSKAEVREGFVSYVTSDVAFKQVMDVHRKKFAEFGLTLQPFVAIVGPSMTDIQSCLVVINNVTYSLQNVLDAVDTCFKVIWSLDAQYSAECHSTWIFIHRAVYNLTTPNDKESTSANTLLGELGL